MMVDPFRGQCADKCTFANDVKSWAKDCKPFGSFGAGVAASRSAVRRQGFLSPSGFVSSASSMHLREKLLRSLGFAVEVLLDPFAWNSRKQWDNHCNATHSGHPSVQGERLVRFLKSSSKLGRPHRSCPARILDVRPVPPEDVATSIHLPTPRRPLSQHRLFALALRAPLVCLPSARHLPRASTPTDAPA